MSEHTTDEELNPIFAELTREMPDPTESDLTVSPPPEFAELLVNEALSGRHRESEDDTVTTISVAAEGQDSAGAGRHSHAESER
ncbi:hypothetical protein [Actinopolyspora mortivallis]|uniref:hypothetical protein n=1 Tax=Actinopolyspora mortivallis TaxID=33906 RepID=UPI000363B397|nr:hypothetical protein [Actinopolyspora mortivallis]